MDYFGCLFDNIHLICRGEELHKLTNTYLIAKHFQIQQGEQMWQPCCICGHQGTGFRKRDIIPNSFMDWDYVVNTDYICDSCTFCLREKSLRTSSFLASESEFKYLKREKLWENIINPPRTHFIFGITYSYKKHISFKSEINMPLQSPFSVRTENANIYINIPELTELLKIMQKWYSICKNTKQEPTFFTKNDILTGCSNYKKIEEYGTNNYLRENMILMPYRNTGLIELLVYTLNKNSYNETKKEAKDDQIGLFI